MERRHLATYMILLFVFAGKTGVDADKRSDQMCSREIVLEVFVVGDAQYSKRFSNTEEMKVYAAAFINGVNLQLRHFRVDIGLRLGGAHQLLSGDEDSALAKVDERIHVANTREKLRHYIKRKSIPDARTADLIYVLTRTQAISSLEDGHGTRICDLGNTVPVSVGSDRAHTYSGVGRMAREIAGMLNSVSGNCTLNRASGRYEQDALTAPRPAKSKPRPDCKHTALQSRWTQGSIFPGMFLSHEKFCREYMNDHGAQPSLWHKDVCKIRCCKEDRVTCVALTAPDGYRCDPTGGKYLCKGGQCRATLVDLFRHVPPPSCDT